MKKIKQVLKKFSSLDQIDLEIFLAEILGKDKAFVVAHPEYRLNAWQFLKLLYFIYQKKEGYSVAAITKHKEFYGLNFYVNKDVLIPRPDTELMVTEALTEIKKQNRPLTLVDVGTGSGCIAISILKNLPKPIPTYAIDISSSALKVARVNAKQHSVQINFRQGNLLEPIITSINQKVVIVANLPYLTEEQFRNESSIWREPKQALVAKNNGLDLYEKLLQQIASANLKGVIFLEIDPGQTTAIIGMIKKYFPDCGVEIKKDLTGLDRLIKITV